MRFSPRRRPRVLVSLAVIGSLSAVTAACSAEAEPAGGAGKKVTVDVLLHALPSAEKAYNSIAKRFEQANPGTTVKFTFAPNENFPQVRNARITAGDIDITEGSSNGSTRLTPDYAAGVQDNDWVRGLKAGLWTQLSGSYLDNYSEGARKAAQFQGKDYGVPTGISFVTGVYYNKDLFQKNGVQVPTTWDEFIAACEAFKAKGITPIVMGGAEKWPVGLVMEGIVSSSVPDMAALDRQLWTGEAKWTDPQQVKVLEKVQKVYTYAPKAFSGMTDSAATAMFASGKAAMFPQGTWAEAGIAQAGAKFDFSLFPLPGSDDASANKILHGKLENNLAIPSNAKDKDAAQKFLAFFSQPENYQEFIDATGFVPVMADVKTNEFVTSIKPYLGEQGFAPTWGDVFHPNPAAGDALKVGFPYDQIAPMGKEKDMTALAQRNQKAWAAALPKK